MQTPNMNYNTGDMNLSHAKVLVDIGRQAKTMQYPDDNAILSSLWRQAHRFLQDNKLTKTAFFPELEKKMANLTVLDVDHAISQLTFEHMKGILDLHAMLIAFKFGLPYQVL